MKFTPKTEEQLERERQEAEKNRLMPYGTVCDFETVGASNEVSSKGSDMIKLVVRVYTPNGDERMFNDYLVSSFEHKLRHAASACGVLDRYDEGNLDAADFLYKSGKCIMGIERDKSGNYPPKNKIADYVKRNPDEKPAVAPTPKSGAELDDEIPFYPNQPSRLVLI